MYVDFDRITKLSKDEQLAMFYYLAEKCGLVKDGRYIDGIPSKEFGATEDDINTWYALEDWLEYPEPKKIPKKYLNSALLRLNIFFEDNKASLSDLMFDLIQDAIQEGNNACKEFISDYEDSTLIYFKWDK